MYLEAAGRWMLDYRDLCSSRGRDGSWHLLAMITEWSLHVQEYCTPNCQRLTDREGCCFSASL